MDIANLIDRLNAELDKLNKLKSNEIDTRNFFTENEHFNDDPIECLNKLEENSHTSETQIKDDISAYDVKTSVSNYQDIVPNNEEKSLIVLEKNYLTIAQNMFKKTIRFSLKSFLISISLSFLNLFV